MSPATDPGAALRSTRMSRTRGPYEELQSRESDAILASDDIEAAGYRMTASSAAAGSTSALAAVGLIKYLLGRPSRYLWGLIRRRRRPR